MPRQVNMPCFANSVTKTCYFVFFLEVCPQITLFVVSYNSGVHISPKINDVCFDRLSLLAQARINRLFYSLPYLSRKNVPTSFSNSLPFESKLLNQKKGRRSIPSSVFAKPINSPANTEGGE